MRYIGAILILILLQVADLATTFYILSRGGVELNPVMAATGEYMYLCMILSKVVFIGILVYLINKLSLTHPRSTWGSCFIVLVMYWVIVGNNLIQTGYSLDLV